jgi:glycosyltransferase involved in cell wall biosynthesis
MDNNTQNVELSIIIPALTESENIGEILNSIAKVVDDNAFDVET